MNRRVRCLLFAFVLLLLPTLAFAASPWMEEADYTAKAQGKFVFGLENLFFGWTELATQPYDSWKAGEDWFRGIGKGLWNAVGQTAGGSIHLATFLVPLDVPLPENGTQFLK